MRCLALLLIALGALVCHDGLLAQAPPVPAADRSKPTIGQWLHFLGLSSVPAQRGEDVPATGTVWVAALDGHPAVRWTASTGFRSPVFTASGEAIYAMRGDTLTRVDHPNGAPVAVLTVKGVSKLLGVAPGEVESLVVLTNDPVAPLALLSIVDGKLSLLDVDIKDAEQRSLIAKARAQTRASGSITVTVENQSKEELVRIVEWTDIVAIDGTGSSRNISACNGVDCSQPSLAPDSTRIAFIHAD